MLVLEMHDKIKASSLCERNKPFAQCVTIHQFKPSWQEWGDIWTGQSGEKVLDSELKC